MTKKTTNTADYIIHETNRVLTFWTTDCVFFDAKDLSGFESAFETGRYSDFISESRDHVPRLLCRRNIHPESMVFSRLGERSLEIVKSAHMRAFLSPEDRLVISLEVFLDCGLLDLTEAMNDLYYRTVDFDGVDIIEYFNKENLLPARKDWAFGNAYHQFVSLGKPLTKDSIDRSLVRSIVYRYLNPELKLREDFSSTEITFVKSLNTRVGSLCVTSPFVTVIYNQQLYVENTMCLSILQMLYAKQALIELRIRARSMIQSITLSERGTSKEFHSARGILVVEKSLELLNLRLSGSVEEPMNVGLILPSLRAQDFHDELFNATGIRRDRDDLSLLYSRIEGVLKNLKGAAYAHEAEHSAIRRSIFAITVTILSLLTAPVTIILAFFSSPVAERPPNPAVFDLNSNSALYLLVFGSFLCAFLIALLIWMVMRFLSHRRRLALMEEIRRRHF